MIPNSEDTDRRFSALMRQHQSMVFSIALRILADRPAAEEAAQDVFIQLHAKLDDLASDEHALFWLRRVTVHRCIDLVRQRQRRPEVAMDWNELPDLPDLSNAQSKSEPELSRQLQQLVSSLPAMARTILMLRYQEDMGPDEISSMLEMPVATVKSHLRRTLRLLREKSARAVH